MLWTLKGNTALDGESHRTQPIVRMQEELEDSSTALAQRDGRPCWPTWPSCTSQEQTPSWCCDQFSCDASLPTHSQLCTHRDSRTSPYHSVYEHGCSTWSHSSSSIHRRDKTPLWSGSPHQSMSCGITAVPSLCVSPRAPLSMCAQSCCNRRGNVLGAGTSYDYHNVNDSHDFLVREPFGSGWCR